MDPVRVRYAPSPTGEPHLGATRTALFNWLLARGSGGTFVVRIEDTDQARKVEGSDKRLLESLHWLGLDWDEGPFYQSERLKSYHRTVGQLVKEEKAYLCYCSPERLADVRREQTRLKKNQRYDRLCRSMSDKARKEAEEKNTPAVVRFAMPEAGSTIVKDLIRGRVSFENERIDDFIILKSDKFPTYHLASVVDDHDMEITHVLRAEEWLSSAPRHIRLYEALGWEPPQLAHLPTILAPDRSKLSKRHGATSVLEYRDQGYLPTAMLNFMALLGWSLDDKTEIFSQKDLANYFSLERVSKSGAVFDIDKLRWMNGHYIRESSHRELADALLRYWYLNPPHEIPELPEKDYLERIVPLVQPRMKTLRDAAPLIPFFFRPAKYETAELVQKDMNPLSTRSALEASLEALEKLEHFDVASTEAVLRPLAGLLGIKTGQLLGSLRVSITGLQVSPPLFESMEVLGRDRTLTAIQDALNRLCRP